MNFDIIAKAKITQKDFADICGVSRITVNLWVGGKMQPHRFLQPKVEAALAALEQAVSSGKLPTKSATYTAKQVLKDNLAKVLAEQPAS